MLESNLNSGHTLQTVRFVLPFMKVFFANFLLKKKVGGPKWTRTTDLTIISRAL